MLSIKNNIISITTTIVVLILYYIYGEKQILESPIFWVVGLFLIFMIIRVKIVKK
jgi:RsiW-degrading membrane proteinase PrsW (M82 family)